MVEDAKHWEELQELFHLVEALPPQDRERVLAEQCADAEMRSRVMELWESSEEVTSADSDREAPALPGSIGGWKPVRHLGSGGIGTVYLVERTVGDIVQQAALKVLAPHAAGEWFVEHFHREQHILASFNHPKITRMLDAGLNETGQPYLVMEYVEGQHFDVYCDERKLGIEERLWFFRYVCDAVSYAHRNLIVHLDLKPSNILVTSDGAVKLLDFGTSKLLQTETNLNLTTTVMATPAYSSPEQLRSEPATTACDVYSLGAILYELLSGRKPVSDASVAMMVYRAMTEQEPEPLPNAVTEEAAERRGMKAAQLKQVLSGDLATIVAKCMRSRPQDRYGSVDELAADVQRYLSGRPVLARRQTVAYRLGKFVRRRRKLVVATALAFLVLVGALVFAEVRQREALREGERAERMQTFMYHLFKLANSSYTGKPAATVPEFLELGIKVLPDFIKDQDDRRQAQLSLAESLYDNGDLDTAAKAFADSMKTAHAAGDVDAEAEAAAFAGHIAYQQGNKEQGEALTAQALELSRNKHVTPSVRVWSEIYYAANRENTGAGTDANLKLLQDAVAESQANDLPEREQAYADYMLASDYELRGRLDEAEDYIRRGIAIYGREPYAICDQSEMYADLAYITGMRGNQEGSLPLWQKAYDGSRTCAGPEKMQTLLIQDNLAGAMIRTGHAKEAVPLMESALVSWRKVAKGAPDFSNPLFYMAMAYVETGRFADAEHTSTELLDVQRGKVDPMSHRWGSSEEMMARALVGQGKYAEALPHAKAADVALAATSRAPAEKAQSERAHQMLLDIEAKLGKHSG
jgi:eukaryotic-like serine/threonine-protein kinase